MSEANPALVPPVPLELFSGAPFEGEITSPSGRWLYCDISSDTIEIRDVKQPQFHFGATARPNAIFLDDGQETMVEGRIMEFGVRTVTQGILRARRHPDLRAAWLFDQAVDFFDSQETLTHIKGAWSGRRCHGTTNYRLFNAALRGIDNPTDQQLQVAAYATWTGQQALRHDFWTVEVERQKRQAIAAFSR